MTVSKSCCFNKDQLTVITKQQRTKRLEYSVVYLIGNEAARAKVNLKKLAFTLFKDEIAELLI